MFGKKTYKNAKIKQFSSDNERKRFFAILNYYNQKEREASIKIPLKSLKKRKSK